MVVGTEESKLPPGPKGTFFLGSAQELRRDPLQFLLRLAREYGDIAHFRLGSRHIYQLNHPDLIKDVLVTDYRRFHKTGLLKQGQPILGNGLFLSEGDFHRRQRRLVQPALHRQRIAEYAPIVVETASRMSEQWRDGDTINMSQMMLDLSLPIITRALFHFNIDSELGEIRSALTTVIEHFNRYLAPSLGILSRLPTSRNLRFRRAQRLLDRTVYEIIREARVRKEKCEGVLSMLLTAQDDEGDGVGMSDSQVRDEVMTLFVAGHETVATALTWTWYLLATTPKVEATLHDEWSSQLAGRPPTASDLPQLRYTEMVVAESMRLFPPVWGMSRLAIEEHQAGPYRIPVGSVVGLSQYVMHRDPRFFADPERFDPLRWTAEEKAKRPKYSYFPFGGGPRLCIGEPLAWMEIILILATLGQRWRPELVPGHILELLPVVTLRPKHGMPMVLRQR